MLWHKAWRETRGRFIAAVIILTVMTSGNVYEYLATQKLLGAFRGEAAVDRDRLAAVLVGLSEAAAATVRYSPDPFR